MLWMPKIYMGSRRHWLDLWKRNQLMVMSLRAWKVLELQVTGNKENTQQPNIVIFPQSDFLLAVERDTVLGQPKTPMGWVTQGGFGDREQNTLGAFITLLPSTLLKMPHWPYNNKAGFPVCSGESPAVSGNLDLQYILFQKLLLTFHEQ